jgi:phytol kinase
MLNLIICVLGLGILLVLSELFGKHKILKGEYQRKFLHISSGAFMASWPWLISWRAIQSLSLLMLIIMAANYYFGVFNYQKRIGRVTYGDIFLALAVLISATISHNKIFFALAILEVAVADGLAALAGNSYGKDWTYKVLGYKKTLIGTMVFWIATASILTPGLLAAHDIFSFKDYYYLLLLLPPALTLIENVAIYGVDNLIIPIFLIAVLRLVQS